MRVTVVVPTYNEADNIETLVRAVRQVLPQALVLVVDDGSPDGTADKAEKLGIMLGQVDVVRRTSKDGLGAAYRAGLRAAISGGAEICVQMDADLSHDPAALPARVAFVEHGADLAIGSRYVPGGITLNWPRRRHFVSRWGNRYAAGVLGLAVNDATAGYRAYRSEVLERMQFEYLKAGFEPSWDKDPYRVFVYTSLQERATQVSHANTGKLASEYEPLIGVVLSNVAKEEARHYVFYREIFQRVLERDPSNAMVSASLVMPSIDMPGVNMPHFREMADVIRRAGIYGPREYIRIVEDLVKFWALDKVEGLNEMGKKAQEKIMGITARLERIADAMETRSKAKTFQFNVAFNKEFAME
jgi:glycosyltransferase involved in cell wall biosynthesis